MARLTVIDGIVVADYEEGVTPTDAEREFLNLLSAKLRVLAWEYTCATAEVDYSSITVTGRRRAPPEIQTRGHQAKSNPGTA